MQSYVIKFSMLLLLSVLSAGAVYAQDQVVDIAVEGNQYIESAAVLAKLKSKVGQPLERSQISQDVRNLFATGYFSDVYTEGERVAGGIKLIFVVVENPVIASITIEGNEEISDKKLKPMMKMKPGLIMSPRVERLTTNNIRKAYLEKGYYQMDVLVTTTMLDDGRVDVVLDIDEGMITHVKDIRFIGNQGFTDEELLEPLASRSSDLGSWFTDRDVFNRDRFEADAQLLRQFYQNHGYLDARIESTRLMLTPSQTSFYLALSIYEGETFTVAGIELQGDLVPSYEVLEEKVVLKKGELYSLSDLQKSMSAIMEAVGDEGFAFANVTPIFHRNIENNTLIVSFDIEKGREVYVERIVIIGNEKTKDNVVRRELRQHEGERYKASSVRRSKERLRRLSYIQNVRFTTGKGSEPNAVNMDLSLAEGKSGSFSAGVTYSEINALAFTGQVEEQNLFGEGYHANVSADVGGARNNYSIRLIDPYLFREDVSGSVSLFRNESDLQSSLLYTQKSNGGTMGLGFSLGEYARYSVGYRVTNTKLTGVPLTSSLALRSQEGTFNTGELTQSLSYDTRNQIMQTTGGGLYAVSLNYAGLTGDHEFYEITGSAKKYMALSDFWTLRLAMNVAKVHGINGKTPPVYRRYSLGGIGSLRGYDIFGVSVVDAATLDILGGEYKSTASLDIMFPLPYMEKAGFRGAFFIDSGTVWGNASVVTEAFDAAKIRGSYGAGIEWASPIGPVTMMWAQPLNIQTYDRTRSFEFALGRGF